jgi:hypothetical protein
MSQKISCEYCGSTKVVLRIVYPGPGALKANTHLATECFECKMATSEPYWESIEQHFGKQGNPEWSQWGEVA